MRFWASDAARRLHRFLLLGACVMHGMAVPGAAQTEPQTAVVVLVDFSKSFAPLGPEDRRALEALADALLRLAGHEWETPVLTFWSSIGSASLLAKSPCGSAIEFAPRLLPGLKKDSTKITDAGLLKAWLAECIRAVVKKSQTPEAYTDISGGVALAAETASGVKHKALVILSDFVEDLPPGAIPATVRLNGEVVVMLYRPEAGDGADPNQFFARLEVWEKRFKDAGARSVCRMPVSGAVSGRLIGCLR